MVYSSIRRSHILNDMNGAVPIGSAEHQLESWGKELFVGAINELWQIASKLWYISYKGIMGILIRVVDKKN